MGKIYQRDHVVYCEIKKIITVTVELQDPSNSQVEKSLDISLTDCHDLYFLFTAKMFSSDYQKLKEQQGLLVEYSAFAQMLVDLLTKCSKEEGSSSPRYILQFSESSPHILRITETTDFRHLTHLAVELTAASDEALKAYLVSVVKRNKAEYERQIEDLRNLEGKLNVNLSNSERIINDISKQLEDVSLTKETVIAALKENHAAELEKLRESHESMIVSVQTKLALERKAAEEATEKMKISMQATIDSQHTELEKLNGLILALNSKVSLLNSSISEKEATLATLRKENDVLKDEVICERTRKEQLDADNFKLNQKICGLETDLAAERQKNHVIDAELIHQKEKVRLTLEDSQRRGKHLERTEKLLKQQTTEIAKANSIIKQLQRELKNSQTKAKLRGQVATEQEKVLTSKELELEDLQQKVEQLKTKLNAEQRQCEDGRAKLLKVESELEEAQKTIKSNENIINWLNRQISESYSTSLHNRLKSSGVPVSGVSDSLFDVSKLKAPFDGGASGVPALKPTNFTAAPFLPLSVTSLTALTSTAGEGLISTGKGQTTTCQSPSVPSRSSVSTAPQTNAGLVLVAAGESSLSRPPILLSATDKSQVSTGHTTAPPREFSTAAVDARKPSNRPSQGTPSDLKCVPSYPLPPKPRTLGYGDFPGFDRHVTPGLDSQSVSCDEKQQQSLTSSFFPQTNTAR
uniref:Spindle assembly abnormal protein 6 homolog n=1 Tax=Schistocephalus solidus TaxID=70667 RepID=A0A0X3NL25_SCHSO